MVYRMNPKASRDLLSFPLFVRRSTQVQLQRKYHAALRSKSCRTMQSDSDRPRGTTAAIVAIRHQTCSLSIREWGRFLDSEFVIPSSHRRWRDRTSRSGAKYRLGDNPIDIGDRH